MQAPAGMDAVSVVSHQHEQSAGLLHGLQPACHAACRGAASLAPGQRLQGLPALCCQTPRIGSALLGAAGAIMLRQTAQNLGVRLAGAQRALPGSCAGEQVPQGACRSRAQPRWRTVGARSRLTEALSLCLASRGAGRPPGTLAQRGSGREPAAEGRGLRVDSPAPDGGSGGCLGGAGMLQHRRFGAMAPNDMSAPKSGAGGRLPPPRAVAVPAQACCAGTG